MRRLGALSCLLPWPSKSEFVGTPAGADGGSGPLWGQTTPGSGGSLKCQKGFGGVVNRVSLMGKIPTNGGVVFNISQRKKVLVGRAFLLGVWQVLPVSAVAFP